MTEDKSVIFVVSHDRKCLQIIENSIGNRPMVVASSVKRLQRLNNHKKIKLVLIDRSLPSSELEEFLDIGDGYPVATFGMAVSSSDTLRSIESTADYRLRHPVAGRDIERLFNYLRDGANSKNTRKTNRSSDLYRGLVGDSPAVRELRELIQTVAPSGSTVLLSGETGTGKEIAARNIHYLSKQSGGPFVPVNCSAIPADLLESELFGHKKGAFTGALSDRKGRFEMASGGTLFLDEIGDMTPALQVKLLRVLEERIIYRVGCNEPIPMTGRLIAASHQTLEECIERDTFWQDLYYRLNVVPIELPALRDRKEDIAQLAAELSCRLQHCHGYSVNLASSAIACLQDYAWPGNERELANLVEWLTVLYPNSTVGAIHLPAKYQATIEPGADRIFAVNGVTNSKLPHQILPKDGVDLKRCLRSTEAELILQALDYSGGTVSQAATLLHVGRTTLTEKVKQLGLSNHVKTTG